MRNRGGIGEGEVGGEGKVAGVRKRRVCVCICPFNQTLNAMGSASNGVLV